MRHRFIAILALAALCFSSPSPSPAQLIGAAPTYTNCQVANLGCGGDHPILAQNFVASSIVASFTASRTSCVAPCHVFLDATATTDVGQTSVPFHELDYQWLCGGVTGTWSYGSNTSRNLAYGPLAVCVFDQAGTYQVNLVVTDANALVTATPTTITVSAANTTFAGNLTTCVSVTSSATGCPAGATIVGSSSLDTAMMSIGTGKRVLLNKGETFTTPCTALIANSTTGPWALDSYGSGAAPIIQNSKGSSCGAAALINIGTGVTDGRIANLAFDCAGVVCTIAVFNSPGSCSGPVLFENLSALGTVTGGISSQNPVCPLDQIAVVNSSITNLVQIAGDCGSMFFANGIKRSALIGNNFDGAQGCKSSYVARVQSFYKLVFTNGNYDHPPASKNTLDIHGPTSTADASLNPSQYAMVRDNRLKSANDTVVSTACAVPPCSTSNLFVNPQASNFSEDIADVIVDSNLLIGDTLTQYGMRIEARNVTIRADIIDQSARVANACNGININRDSFGATPPQVNPTNIWISNVTLYGPNCPGAGSVLVNYATTAGAGAGPYGPTSIKNSIVYAPMSAGAAVYTITGCAGCGGYAPTVATNTTDFTINPFAMTPSPTDPTTYAPDESKYAKAGSGSAVPGVLYDFLRNKLGGSYPIGAIK